ncbi:MAG: T9SS type A sorting domain-containing protein [Flavobacteriales bacterium]|nr:T9SS type A sorting domain-containing protein [Flavobacteriales bacterium]
MEHDPCDDCPGVPNGNAEVDACGVCYAGGASNPLWNTTCADCAGVPNGNSEVDACGVCYAGGASNPLWNTTCADCAGVPNGTAFLDNCNECVGGTTGLDPCTDDCLGVPGGNAEVDACGVCYAGGASNPLWNTTCADCAGVPNGNSEVDACGVCYAGGASNPLWNTTCADCAGVPNGNSEVDACGVCYAGGASNPLWNTTCADCAGVPNGNSEVDACGVCYAGGASNPLWNTTCADCAGVPNGNSEVDACGVCYAGGASNPDWNSTCADCAGVPNGPDTPGEPCDDLDPDTEGDTWSNNCTCVGTPIGCDQSVNLIITTDDNGAETSWEIIPAGGGTALCEGGPYVGVDNSVIGENCCLADGCYALRVYDSAGDGMTTGGYVLKESGTNGRRIIDNSGNGQFGSVSAIANGAAFCLPVGDDRVLYSHCDRLYWESGQFIVATENAAVSAAYATPTLRNSSGYLFWFFDPNGSYSFRRFRKHSESDGAGTGALRANHFRINAWTNTPSSPHLPEGVLLNVRIMGRVNWSWGTWGPACLFKIDPALAQCPPTNLVNTPGIPEYSCGVFKPFGSNAKLYTWARPGANSYQFEFTLPGEGTFEKVLTGNSNQLVLNWVEDPLVPGVTYHVRTRLSRDHGVTWCPWGEVCLVTITNPQSGIAPQAGTSTIASATPKFTAWPNPNNGHDLFIAMSNIDPNVERVGVEMYDLVGKQVVSRQVAIQDGVLKTKVELSTDMGSGVYLLRVSVGSFVTTERIVIQR